MSRLRSLAIVAAVVAPLALMGCSDSPTSMPHPAPRGFKWGLVPGQEVIIGGEGTEAEIVEEKDGAGVRVHDRDTIDWVETVPVGTRATVSKEERIGKDSSWGLNVTLTEGKYAGHLVWVKSIQVRPASATVARPRDATRKSAGPRVPAWIRVPTE